MNQTTLYLTPLLLLFLLGASSFLIAEGCVRGTLVATPTGYTPIEDFKKGDQILSYDLTSNMVVNDYVIDTFKDVTLHTVEIVVEGTSFEVAANHLFYSPFTQNPWVSARSVKKGMRLFTEFKTFNLVESVIYHNSLRHLFSVSTQYNHNFFITKQNILVHNIALHYYPLSFILQNRYFTYWT